MEATTMKLDEVAREAYGWFETATRYEGEPGRDAEDFTRLKDGAPAWLTELVHEAHGDFLPDDWRYATIRSAIGWIADNDGVFDDPEEGEHEFADAEVDAYTNARFEWLSSHIQRQFYVDEAMSEYGAEGGVAQAIGLGQYVEAREVFASVLSSLRGQAEE